MMEGSPVPFLIFKAILGFGVPIAVCIQQLIVTKRAIRADREAAAQAAASPAAPASGSEPNPSRAEAPARERVLEPA